MSIDWENEFALLFGDAAAHARAFEARSAGVSAELDGLGADVEHWRRGSRRGAVPPGFATSARVHRDHVEALAHWARLSGDQPTEAFTGLAELTSEVRKSRRRFKTQFVMAASAREDVLDRIEQDMAFMLPLAPKPFAAAKRAVLAAMSAATQGRVEASVTQFEAAVEHLAEGIVGFAPHAKSVAVDLAHIDEEEALAVVDRIGSLTALRLLHSAIGQCERGLRGRDAAARVDNLRELAREAEAFLASKPYLAGVKLARAWRKLFPEEFEELGAGFRMAASTVQRGIEGCKREDWPAARVGLIKPFPTLKALVLEIRHFRPQEQVERVKRVEERLRELETDENVAAVRPILEGVAEALAQVRATLNPHQASAVLATAEAGVDEARRILAGLKAPGEAATKDLNQAWQALSSHPCAGVVSESLRDLEARLQKGPEGVARLQWVGDLLGALAVAERQRAVDTAREALEAERDEIALRDQDKVVVAALDEVKEELRAALVALPDQVLALARLGKGLECASGALLYLDGWDDYVPQRDDFRGYLSELVDSLPEDRQHELTFLHEALAAAEVKARAEQDPRGALAVLDAAFSQADDVDLIEKHVPSGVQAAVLESLLERRFHVRYTHDASGGYETVEERNLSVKGIYEVLSLVPDRAIRDNDSLKAIQRISGEEFAYGSYLPTTGVITLRCGRPETAPPVELAHPKELPEVIPECRPAEDISTPTRFDWAVLHELGHSEDDDKDHMSEYGRRPSFGGWKVHSIDEIAEIAHAALGYDEDYARELLYGYEPPALACPDTVDEFAWEAQREQLLDWCSSVREHNKPWDDGAACQRLVLGTRVYHEAYADRDEWVSYELEARKQGITGYQFRAPGEWFAELYTAYIFQKLQASHPAVRDGQGWLPRLLANGSE